MPFVYGEFESELTEEEQKIINQYKMEHVEKFGNRLVELSEHKHSKKSKYAHEFWEIYKTMLQMLENSDSELVRHEVAFQFSRLSSSAVNTQYLTHVVKHDPSSTTRHEAALALPLVVHPLLVVSTYAFLQRRLEFEQERIVRESIEYSLRKLQPIVEKRCPEYFKKH